MKKFYQKNEVSQEETPILLRLERRHTLMAGDQDPGKDRRASRANSVGSVSGSTPSVSTPVVNATPPPTDKCMSDDKHSIFSRASTVVITESELSSSWLYNNKKAQIDSINETSLASQSGTASGSLDNLIPETLQDDRRSKPAVPVRSRRQTSCCCYMTIALFILLASLGILTAIGGIIYMELFPAYVEKSNHTTATQTDQDRLGNMVVELSTKETHTDVERTLNATLASKTHFSDGELNSSAGVQNENKLHPISNENNVIGGESFNKNGDHINQSVDLPDSIRNDGNEKEVTRELSDEDKLDLFLKFNQAVNKHFFFNESQVPRISPNDPNTESQTEIEPEDDFVNMELDSYENSSYSDIDDINNWSDAKADDPVDAKADDHLPVIQGQLAYLPFDEVMNTGTNKEDMREGEFGHSKENSHNSMDSNDSFSQQNIHNEGMEASNDSSAEDSISLDRDRIFEHVTESPSVDQKGVPFEFFRRLGFNEASFSAHPALTVEDMNVKFSLAEALKYLRSLDTNNKLPTSRQKLEILSRNPKKMADAGKERGEYLTKLRENLFG